MEPHASRSLRRVLYRLESVEIHLADERRLGPITWTLERGRRVGVRCAHPGQWQGLVDLLTGVHRPDAGRLEELETATVQTDGRARESVHPNLILEEYLHTPDVPEFVWLEGRRRSIGVLVDLLGITPAMTRHALRYGPPELLDRVWALRFMLSQAHLLLANELFSLPDPAVREALRRRWSDFPGALVVCAGRLPLPATPDTWVEFDAEGNCTGPQPADGATPDPARRQS